MRLTARGRRVVMAFAVLVLAAVATPFALSATTGAQAANHGVSAATVTSGMRQVVVRPGETLWSIALRTAPTADPRLVIQQIIDFNALGSEVVVPGERLWVPKS
ncbi:MAG TPA: LysM peptidoglycan-binding domain-containing protein [Streptosporangiaceae bacterium]|nr:LysM peptidoglycan-binding domain-containing protein [Streptosporangiaceae bacterium]